MTFEYRGVKYHVSWKHRLDTAEPDTEKVSDILARLYEDPALDQRERGVPQHRDKKIVYDGLTICTIRTPKENAADLPPAERWVTIAEGYAFKRKEDPFNKPLGRKISFQRALNSKLAFPVLNEQNTLTGQFNAGARDSAWHAFHTIWPPRANDNKARDKRYERLQRSYLALQDMTNEYKTKLQEYQKLGFPA